MIVCDKCPCFYNGEDEATCRITGIWVALDFDIDRYTEKNCPLKRIELKDGTVFTPEEYVEQKD